MLKSLFVVAVLFQCGYGEPPRVVIPDVGLIIDSPKPTITSYVGIEVKNKENHMVWYGSSHDSGNWKTVPVVNGYVPDVQTKVHPDGTKEIIYHYHKRTPFAKVITPAKMEAREAKQVKLEKDDLGITPMPLPDPGPEWEKEWDKEGDWEILPTPEPDKNSNQYGASSDDGLTKPSDVDEAAPDRTLQPSYRKLR
jgi:hypothetical protein